MTDKEIKEQVAPIKSGMVQLTGDEILKLKNLLLQKQLANKELENVSLQEHIISGMISARVGEDVSRWQFDLQRGIAVKTNQNPSPE